MSRISIDRGKIARKDDTIHLGHMLDAAREALALVQGKKRSDFDRDVTLRFALAHWIQITGEMARRVSPECQQAHAQILWIISMRHKVVDSPLDLDDAEVWDTVTIDLPKFVAQMEKIVPVA